VVGKKALAIRSLFPNQTEKERGVKDRGEEPGENKKTESPGGKKRTAQKSKEGGRKAREQKENKKFLLLQRGDRIVGKKRKSLSGKPHLKTGQSLDHLRRSAGGKKRGGKGRIDVD